LALFYEVKHPEEQHINALRLVLAEKVTRVLKRYQNKAGAGPKPPLWRFAKDQLLRYMPLQLQKTINTNDSLKKTLESLSIPEYCALTSGNQFPLGAIEIEAWVEHLKISSRP